MIPSSIAQLQWKIKVYNPARYATVDDLSRRFPKQYEHIKTDLQSPAKLDAACDDWLRHYYRQQQQQQQQHQSYQYVDDDNDDEVYLTQSSYQARDRKRAHLRLNGCVPYIVAFNLHENENPRTSPPRMDCLLSTERAAMVQLKLCEGGHDC